MITGALSSKNSWIGILLTLFLIGLGIYIGVKHYKEPGFWFGIVALLLVMSSVMITPSE